MGNNFQHLAGACALANNDDVIVWTNLLNSAGLIKEAHVSNCAVWTSELILVGQRFFSGHDVNVAIQLQDLCPVFSNGGDSAGYTGGTCYIWLNGQEWFLGVLFGSLVLKVLLNLNQLTILRFFEAK